MEYGIVFGIIIAALIADITTTHKYRKELKELKELILRLYH